jgi:hypothetical protein
LSGSTAVQLGHFLARPCPFYSSGKCFFAQACNFRHDVVVKSPKPKGSPNHIIPQISYTLPDDESRRSSIESSVFSLLDLNNSDVHENKASAPDVHIRGLGSAKEEIERSSELDSPIQLVQDQKQDNRSSRAPEALAYL